MSSLWVAIIALGPPMRFTARVVATAMMHSLATADVTRFARRRMRTELNAGSLHLRIPANPPDRTACPARSRT